MRRTSGARNPGVPARGAVWWLLEEGRKRRERERERERERGYYNFLSSTITQTHLARQAVHTSVTLCLSGHKRMTSSPPPPPPLSSPTAAAETLPPPPPSPSLLLACPDTTVGLDFAGPPPIPLVVEIVEELCCWLYVPTDVLVAALWCSCRW